jgi:hypothetical protein
MQAIAWRGSASNFFKKENHIMSKRKDIQTVGQQAKAETFVIKPKTTASIAVEIGGRSLIQNAFSQKAIEEMLRKHMGLSVQREKKNPRKVIEAAIIRNVEGTVCMPVVALKCAMLTASGTVKTFERKKTLLKTSLYIEGDSIPVEFDKMVPRMDMVRCSDMNRTPDIRFRPNFIDWKMRLVLVYANDLFQVQTMLDLLQRAGDVGIGEWRPEKNGVHGRFNILRAIDSSKEIAEVRAACAVPLKTPEIPEWALDANIDMTLLAKLFSPGADGGEASEEGKEATGTAE